MLPYLKASIAQIIVSHGLTTSDYYAENDMKECDDIIGGSNRVVIAMRSLNVSMAEVSQESWS
jgi:hypothetical protein